MKLHFVLLALWSQGLTAFAKQDAKPSEAALNEKNSPCAANVLQNSDLVASMLEMIDYPFVGLPTLVSKSFADAVEKMDLAKVFAEEITKCPALLSIKGSELSKHFWLRSFTKGRFSEIFTAGSIIQPESIEMMEYAARIVLGNPFFKDMFKKSFFTRLARHFIEHELIEILNRLLEIVPAELIYNSSISQDVMIRALTKLARLNLQNAIILLNSQRNMRNSDEELIAAVMSAPSPTEIIAPLISGYLIIRQNCPHPAYRAISLSCWQHFVEYTPEQQAMLHSRNMELCAHFAEPGIEEVSRFDYEFAQLISAVRFRAAGEDELIGRIKMLAKQFASSDLSDVNDFRCFHVQPILIAAIYSGQRTLFEVIWNEYKPYWAMRDLFSVIRQHPDFVQHVLVTRYDEFTPDFKVLKLLMQYELDKHGREFVAKKIKQDLVQISDQIVALATMNMLDELTATVTNAGTRAIRSGYHPHIVMSIRYLMEELSNPISFINILLPYVWTQTDLTNVFGDERYLRAFLRDDTNESDRIVALERAGEIITPSVHFVYSLLTDSALAANVGLESNRHIVARFRISWRDLYGAYILKSYHIVRLFQILQMPITDLSFGAPINSDSMAHYNALFSNGTLEEIGKYTKAPSFLSHLIMHIATLDVTTNVFFKESVLSNTPNPFLLRSFHLFAWWLHCNHESFVRYAPRSVVRAFLPEAETTVLVPNPLLTESAQLYEQLCREEFWAHAPEAVNNVRTSFLSTNTAEIIYPLRNCNPFEIWYHLDRQSFLKHAPFLAKIGILFSHSKLPEMLSKRVAVVLRPVRDAYLSNRTLSLFFSTQEALDQFHADTIAPISEHLEALNCRIQLELTLIEEFGSEDWRDNRWSPSAGWV